METTEPPIPNETTKPPVRLPTEIVLLILIHLDHHTLLAATASCRQWYFLARDYRQYIWRHLALRDFSFTAARGLWKLNFLKDKDLRACFPPPQRPSAPPRPRYQQQQHNSLTNDGNNKKNHLIHATSFLSPSSVLSSPTSAVTTTPSLLYRSGNTSRTGSELAPICASCWASLQKETENTGMQRSFSKEQDSPLKEGSVVDHSFMDNAERNISTISPTEKIFGLGGGGGCGECTEGAQEPHSMDNNTRIPTLPSRGNCTSCLQSLDHKGKRRADDESSSSQEFITGDHQNKETPSQEEQDWKALYQMTSNWYRGRAKGYCPLMLPSLTTLASATRSLSDRSGLGLDLDSGSNLGTRNVCGTGLQGAGADTLLSSPCTPAQGAIQRLLKKRKPVAVIGLQHEGSSLTAVSLTKIPVEAAVDPQSTESSRVQLLRSNPHYREKRSLVAPTADQLDSSSGTNLASTSDAKPPNPNIMMQDPRRHENVTFAIHAALPTPTTTSNDNSVGETDLSTGLGAGTQLPHQQHSGTSVSQPLQSPGQVTTLSDLANDILCHYSSPFHQFLVTGHMDGVVRLWDLSIQEPGRQCIRFWQTGPRRRVLCVGMNSNVVVCGNVDSTICVWDIHPSPGSSSSTHGTIHTASYMTSRAPHGLDDWISGIEHICVGDSLVACSTEFSGSVLVFSLGTGSLVYEIPGLYQPSKMCMTDFFLLTGGRGAWNQGGTHRRLNQLGQDHDHHHQQQQHHLQGGFGLQGYQTYGGHLGGAHYGQDTDVLRHTHQQGLGVMETDEHMSCCVNVWDLRTGDRLYSLIPRLPMRHLQQSKDISSILNSPQSRGQGEQDQQRGKKQTIRTTSYSPMINMTQHTGRWTMPPSLAATSTTHHQLDGFDDASSDGGGLTFSGSSSRNSANTGRGAYTTVSPLSPQQPISAPLTLLDIAVTPDHSTLVVTLCERSGEGLEGVYCWDFGGSRLEGYHEEAPDVSTMIMDQNDLEYRTVANTVLADDHDEDENGFLDEDHDNGNVNDDYGERIIDNDDDDDRYSNDRIHNNMVMQQVDSTVLREMHQARVTGKLWIGWKLDERQFLRRKEGAMARAKAIAASQKLANRHYQQQSYTHPPDPNSSFTSMEQLSL